MTPLRSFHLVPIPSVVAAATALTIWSVWWLGTQARVIPLGLDAIELALLTGFALRLGLGMVFSKATQALWAGSQRIYGVISVGLVGTLLGLAVWVPYPDAAQIAYTLGLLFFPVTKIWFVLFSPEDLHRMPNAFARMGVHLKGTQTLLALFGLVMTFTSAALIGLGDDALWIAFITGGALILQILINWVVVLWTLTQPDETDTQG